MRLTIIKEDLFIFTKIIKFLARTSTELYMVLKHNSMTLKAIDLSETIIAFAKFQTTFFDEFHYDYIKKDQWSDPDCNPNIFLISAKCLLIALKQAKSFAKLTILFDNDKEPEKLVMQVEHNSGYKIRKQMNLLDIVDYSKAEPTKYSVTDVVKNVYFSPSVIHNFINNLKKEMDELELVFSKNTFQIKNSTIDDETLKFNIKLDTTEFTSYNVVSDDETSFVIRSSMFFRMIDFAKSLDDNKLHIYFTKTSEPVSTVLEAPRFTVNAVQSTINKEGGKYCRKKVTKTTKPKASSSTNTMSKSFTSIILEEFNFSEVSQHVNLIDDTNDKTELSSKNAGKFQFKMPTAPSTSAASNLPARVPKFPPSESITANSSMRIPVASTSNSSMCNANEFLPSTSVRSKDNLYDNNDKRHSGDSQEKRRKRSSIENDPSVVNKETNCLNRTNDQDFPTIVDDNIEMDVSRKSQQSRQNTKTSSNTSINSPLNENIFFKNNKPDATSTQRHKIRSHPVMSTKYLIPDDLGILCPGSDEEDDY